MRPLLHNGSKYVVGRGIGGTVGHVTAKGVGSFNSLTCDSSSIRSEDIRSEDITPESPPKALADTTRLLRQIRRRQIRAGDEDLLLLRTVLRTCR